MSKFSKERIQKHLESLAEQIAILRELHANITPSFSQDKTKYYAAYHAFFLAIQNMMDIGGHILASVYKIPFDEYKAIIPALAKQKVITRALEQKCRGMAEFRNKLIHGYLAIEPKKVLGYLKKDLPAIEEFARQIVVFIGKQK